MTAWIWMCGGVRLSAWSAVPVPAKSVMLREIIGLQRPSGGRIELLGTDVWNAGFAERTR